MNFKDLEIRHSYINQGPDGLVEAFLNPALKYATEYKRSAGYFSSDGLIPLMDGLTGLARNHGKVKLIASPKLNDDDVEAIKRGYDQRQKYISQAFSRDFSEEIEKLPEIKLQFLCELISSGVLDIKIVVLKGQESVGGMYHDKLGVLHDADGNSIAFYGSPNASYGGYKGNYERVRLATSWEESFAEIVREEEAEFDSLWENTNPFLEVFDYTEIAEKQILQVIHRRSSSKSQSGIKLRDYQEDAISAWVEYKKIDLMVEFANFGITKLLEEVGGTPVETMENLMNFLTATVEGHNLEIDALTEEDFDILEYDE